MSQKARFGARPVLVTAIAIATAGGWLVTRPNSTTVFVPSPPDSGPVDSAPAGELPSPVTMADPWPRHVIYNVEVGADGVDIADINGDGRLDVVTPWEDTGKVTVSLHPGYGAPLASPWPTVVLDSAAGAVEGASFCDVDQDGHLDVVAASESERVLIFFSPTNPADLLTVGAWTAVRLTAAEAITNWMQSACADFDGDGFIDLVVGGKLYPGQQVAIFKSTTPRVAASWTRSQIGDNGWTMYMVAKDVDVDGDMDVVLSDRTYYGPATPATEKRGELTGSRWLERRTVTGVGATDVFTVANHGYVNAVLGTTNRVYLETASGGLSTNTTYWAIRIDANTFKLAATEADAVAGVAIDVTDVTSTLWINHTINKPVAKGDPKWADATGATTVYDCSSDATRNFVQKWTTTNWLTWTGTQIYGTSGSPGVPASIGLCQDIEPGDVDSDGDDDLVITFAQALDSLSVVIWLRNDGANVWTRGEIGGSGVFDGTKADNVRLYDIDNDGDLDAVVTLAEPEQLGLVWYENPWGVP